MPFYAQANLEVFAQQNTWRVYEAVESKGGVLEWSWVEEMDKDWDPHPNIPHLKEAWLHGGTITAEEAERVTGVSAPACWDWIRDRLGNLIEKEKP